MAVPPRHGVTLTGSEIGCYSELPKYSGSLASDGASNDLLQPSLWLTFRVAPFFNDGSIRRLLCLVLAAAASQLLGV